MTTADKIRAMTNEEMVKFMFQTWMDASWCKNEPCNDSCISCWREWLNKDESDSN